ncbi:MAG: SMP-30/gluconolactonase/LRE family protein [Planctomycetota bacterium]|nr:SMP-30/gluconolactonase/LRE family protein [Planctomycetota bacterium]
MRTVLSLVFVLLLLGSTSAESPSHDIEKVATGYRFTEGPAVDAKGAIFFTDIPNERIHRYDPKTKKAAVHREDTGRANGLMFDAKGALLACEGGRRRLVRIEGDKVTVLAEKYEGKRLNSPNDLAIDAKGGVYFTDPRYGKQDDRELDFEGVYYRAPDGTLTRVAKEAVKPNGILLNAEGTTLYVADSRRKLILAYDVKQPGVLENGRTFATLGLRERGGPDGMTRDAEGNVYCAGQRKVWIWDKKGTVLHEIPMPESPTNCVVVDEDGWTLYVTARTSLYRVTRKAKETPKEGDG